MKRFFAKKFIGPDAALGNDETHEFHLVAGNPSRYRPFSIRTDISRTQTLPDDIRINVERQWHRVESIYKKLEANCETVPEMPNLASLSPLPK